MLLHPRSEADAHPTGPVEVTVIIRWIPLVTAACGTRVARPTRTAMLAPGGDGAQLGGRVRPALVDHCIVGKQPKGARQPWARSPMVY
jgi:hypothetical protein